MSPKLKCNQNWNVTKTETSQKLKCYQNWNVTKSENVLKSKYKSNTKSRRGALITLLLFFDVNKFESKVMKRPKKSQKTKFPEIWFQTLHNILFLTIEFLYHQFPQDLYQPINPPPPSSVGSTLYVTGGWSNTGDLEDILSWDPVTEVDRL